MPYAEMLVNFFASPGHQKVCSLYISSLLHIEGSWWMNVSQGKFSSVDICMETNFTTKAAAPTERPYQRHRKVGKSLPEKESFCVSSEPSKTPEAGSDNSVIPLNLFGVANQMWSVCAFVCDIQDPI